MAAIGLAVAASCTHPFVVPKPRTADHNRHNAAVTAQIQPYIDADVLSSVAIGMIDGDHTEVFGFGRGPNGGATPDSDTVFELGSITKVFTALMLIDSVTRHEVELSTPVVTLLPLGVTVPTEDGAVITLGELMTHRSGLPRLPVGLKTDSSDPYERYGEDALYLDLQHTRLESKPGTALNYSNFGTGLLGFVLARKAGGHYEQVLAKRILGPLGLKDTFQHVPKGVAGRHAIGHDANGGIVPFWGWDALAGAGALRSTVGDQLKFLRALLDAAAGGHGPLAAELRQSMQPVDPAIPGAGYGWFINDHGRRWHNGGTAGFHSFVAVDPERHRALVIMAATSNDIIDGLAATMFDVLDGRPPPPPVFPDEAAMKLMIGTYGDAAHPVVVRRDGKKLMMQGRDAAPVRLVPLARDVFYVNGLDAKLSFAGQGGDATQLIIVDSTKREVLNRVPDASLAPPTQPAVVPAPPAAPATPPASATPVK